MRRQRPGWIQALLSNGALGTLRHCGAVAMTCELGMHTHYTNLPNPAAFPACCLIVSEMDAAVGRWGVGSGVQSLGIKV